MNNLFGLAVNSEKNNPKIMDKNCSLLSLPGNQEIVAGALVVFAASGEIIVCKNLKDYLNYLDDLENND